VPRKIEIIAELIYESRKLEDLGRGVQGARELTAAEDEINVLVERCREWFARALAVVPEEFRDRLRAEFNGSWHSNKIKHFLEAPGEVSLFGKDHEDGTPSPLPYWQHPYETTFHGPLLAIRQILVEAQQRLQGSGWLARS
jgi:hypothetical protein